MTEQMGRPAATHKVILGCAATYAVPCYVWFSVAGTQFWLIDCIALGLGAGAAILLAHFASKRYAPIRIPLLVLMMAALFSVPWSLLSVADMVRVRSLNVTHLDPDRFLGVNDRYGSARIGIALSGGGYRAALVHAGVLDALETQGVYVDNISAVSGGAIIGAYYALGGLPSDFRDAVANGHFNFRRELLKIENVIRLACPQRWSRVDWLHNSCTTRLRIQERLLDRRLYGSAKFTESLAHQPRLLVNATDLRSGAIVGFATDFIMINAVDDIPMIFRIGSRANFREDLTFARIVSISGAFPGAFESEAMELKILPPSFLGATLEKLGNRFGVDLETATQPQRIIFELADGGIRENLGISQLRAAALMAYSDAAPVVNYSPPGHPITLRRFGAGKWWFENGLSAGADWIVQTALVSEGGATLDGWYPGSALKQVARAIDLATYTDKDSVMHPRYLPPDLFQAHSLGNIEQDLEVHAFHPLNAITASLEFERASDDVWQYLARPEVERRAAVLPETYDGDKLLAAFLARGYERGRSPFGSRNEPMPLLPADHWAHEPNIDDPPLFASLNINWDQVELAPDWDRDIQSLWQWIQDGNCTSDNDWAAHFKDRFGDCDSLALATAFSHDRAYVERIFKKSSTLKDVYSPSEAAALYRLGQYRVHEQHSFLHLDLRHLER